VSRLSRSDQFVDVAAEAVFVYCDHGGFAGVEAKRDLDVVQRYTV
jgi:hypothetical protein